MSEMGTRERALPGAALYAEHTGRFARMLDDQAEKALDEYGFTFIYSVDESDSAAFLKSLNLIEESWRQSFLETVALHRRGKLAEAEKQYKDLLAKDPSHKEIEYNLAALHLQRGDTDQARKHLDNFEKYLSGLPEANPFVQESRVRVQDLSEELKQF